MSKRLDYNQIAPAGVKALGGVYGCVRALCALGHEVTGMTRAAREAVRSAIKQAQLVL